MHRIGRIDGARLRNIHLHGIGWFEAAAASLDVLVDEMKIFHLQTSNGHGHPAVLVPMVVNGTSLTHFPTNSQQFIERSAIDKIAGVVLAVPGQIRSQRIGANRSFLHETPHRFCLIERGCRKLPQVFDKFLNGDGFGRGDHELRSRRKYSAEICVDSLVSRPLFSRIGSKLEEAPASISSRIVSPAKLAALPDFTDFFRRSLEILCTDDLHTSLPTVVRRVDLVTLRLASSSPRALVRRPKFLYSRPPPPP